MSPTLSPLQQAVYYYVCRGYTPAETLAALGAPWTTKTVANTKQDVLRKFGMKRMELILAFNEAACHSEELPLNAYTQAAEIVQRFSPAQLRVIAAHHAHWQAYHNREPGSTQEPPTFEQIAKALNMPKARMCDALRRAYRLHVGEGRLFTPKLVRLYDMALHHRQMMHSGVHGVDLPDGLSLFEKITYTQLCYGADNRQIAAKLGDSVNAAGKLVAKIAKKTGRHRIEIALRFLNQHGISDYIPIEAYRLASQRIAALPEEGLSLLTEYARQWRCYMAANPRPDAPPDRTSLRRAFEMHEGTLRSHILRICRTLGITCNRETRDCAMLRLYEMSRIYADFVADYGDV